MRKENVRRMSSRKRSINGSIRPRPSAEDVRYYDLTLELGTDAKLSMT